MKFTVLLEIKGGLHEQVIETADIGYSDIEASIFSKELCNDLLLQALFNEGIKYNMRLTEPEKFKGN